MPLYDYNCDTCGKTYEIQHKMADPAPKSGPQCQRTDCSLVKQLSLVAGVIKSPNPFVAGNGKPQIQGHFSPALPKKEEKAHVCVSGCAMHNR